MQKSPLEKVKFDLRIERLEKMIEEILNYWYVHAEDLPLMYKETAMQIHTSAMVPPGGWRPVLDQSIVKMHDESLVWLRTSFSVDEAESGEMWCLFFQFANQDPSKDRELVEGTVWLDGNIYQGVDKNHQEVFLGHPDPSHDHRVTARVYFKPWHKHCRVVHSQLRRMHMPSFQLYHRFRCLLDTAKLSDPDSPSTQAVLESMETVLFRIPYTDPGTEEYYRGVEEVIQRLIMPEEISEGVWSTARAFGHAHIDVAWLWPLEETRLKAVSTFATACRLMDEYPHFTFLQSQPELYEFVRKREPALFDRVKKHAAEGRWIPQGATWVECDCNVPSGESLVRQFLYGKEYFWKHFLVDCSVLWLPDTFGFNGQLPQIMKGAEVDYFVTSKISWNRYTRFPYDSFRWQGIDGTTVVANYLTASNRHGPWATYNCFLTPEELKNAWTHYAQKDMFNEVMVSYGFGDGGGGPTREMLERLPFMAGLPGIPEVSPGRPSDTFVELEKIKENLPLWRGELYLEYHRGTLTSRAAIKRLNRRCEHVMGLLESAVAIDMLVNKRPADEEDLNAIGEFWKIIMMNQFHDIIAGSSIHRVNEEAEEQLNEVRMEAGRRAKKILGGIFERSNGVLFNPHGFCVKQQVRDEKNTHATVFKSVKIDPFSVASPASGTEVLSGDPPVKVIDSKIVENRFYVVEITRNGEIKSLKDKRVHGEELVEPGRLFNLWKFYEDRPLKWDAWDIDEYYMDSPLEGAETIESSWVLENPHRAVFRVVKSFRSSRLLQDLVFYSHTPRIDFKTTIQWKNRNVLIKAAFPMRLNTRKCYYEIPFGYMVRPTHRNQPDDRARFEAPAQRWAAMFENGRGAALLNDCKYGYSAIDNELSLTLLKSAVYPDPDGEAGTHQFTYSIMPVDDSAPNADLVREAELLNYPAVRLDFQAGSEPGLYTNPGIRIESGGDHVFVSSLKPSADGRDVILRMYEALNRRGRVRVTLPDSIVRVFEANLLEKELRKVPVQTEPWKAVELYIKPFEIKTLRLALEE